MKTDISSGVAARLETLPLADEDERARWRVGRRTPQAVAFPRSVDELAELMGRASEEGWSVVPAGDGAWIDGGGLPTEVDLVVSTRQMRGVIEYVPDDLTLTAEAGLDLATLSRTTREHGQWLAQDPPGWSGATLGAFASTGLPGPLVAGYGRPRDHLLGLTSVTGDGRILRPGGRVVKNVAGYDLVRLLAGSWGTLGVIASVTVRLFPVPRRDVTLRFDADDPVELLQCARALATAPVVPEALELEWESDTGGGSGGATLAARILGSAEEVAEKEEVLRDSAPGSPEAVRLEGDEGPSIEGEEAPSLPDPFPDRLRTSRSQLSLRLSALPAELEGLFRVASDLRARSREQGSRSWIRASVTRGTVRVEIAPPASGEAGFAPEPWRVLLESSRASLAGAGGSLTILRGPTELLDVVDSRAPAGGSSVLREGIRREMDPAGILAPGRMGRRPDTPEPDPGQPPGDAAVDGTRRDLGSRR